METQERSGAVNDKKLGMGGWIALGIPLGMIFGMLIFPDNIAVGIAIGLALGVAIGASQEKQGEGDDQS